MNWKSLASFCCFTPFLSVLPLSLPKRRDCTNQRGVDFTKITLTWLSFRGFLIVPIIFRKYSRYTNVFFLKLIFTWFSHEHFYIIHRPQVCFSRLDVACEHFTVFPFSLLAVWLSRESLGLRAACVTLADHQPLWASSGSSSGVTVVHGPCQTHLLWLHRRNDWASSCQV